MNGIDGFPGIILLFAVAALMLGTTNGVSPIAAPVIVGLGLVSSVGAHFTHHVVAVRRAEAQSAILRDYKTLIIGRYLDGKDKIDAEQVNFAIDHIINKPLGGHPELPEGRSNGTVA